MLALAFLWLNVDVRAAIVSIVLPLVLSVAAYEYVPRSLQSTYVLSLVPLLIILVGAGAVLRAFFSPDDQD